jgi:hypothetical protein
MRTLIFPVHTPELKKMLGPPPSDQNLPLYMLVVSGYPRVEFFSSTMRNYINMSVVGAHALLLHILPGFQVAVSHRDQELIAGFWSLENKRLKVKIATVCNGGIVTVDIDHDSVSTSGDYRAFLLSCPQPTENEMMPECYIPVLLVPTSLTKKQE